MHTITLNIRDAGLLDKISWLLEHFKEEGLEIISKEDLNDLKLLRATRGEESVAFEEYLKNEIKLKTEDEYNKIVELLDSLIDEVGEDESHPLASFMDILGLIIERYESEHVPEITEL